MSETETTTETGDGSDKLVNIKRENYQTSRTASGGKSLMNGDFVATTIEGMLVDELYQVSDKFLVWAEGKEIDLRAKYENTSAGKPMNPGMQRMNLGNRFRKRVKDIDAANTKAAEQAEKDGKTPKAAKSGEDQFTAACKPFAKARDDRAKADAKAKADKEKADKKAKADKKKADDAKAAAAKKDAA